MRAHRTSFPPNGRERYGERLENSGELVLPLEEKFAILKRCKENWGAKWILRKASSAISVMDGQKRGKEQPEAYKRFLESLKTDTGSRPPVLPSAVDTTHASAREYFTPQFTLPRIRLTRQGNINLPNITMYDSFASKTNLEPAEYNPIDFQRKIGLAKLPKMEPGINGPFEFGPFDRAPFIPSYGRGVYTPEGNSSTLMNSNASASKYSFTDDDKACEALFKESKSWLAAGPTRTQRHGKN